MRIALLTVAIVAVFLMPGPASAATCSQYPNQAAAQAAADTVDGDGDGIYCESLPCPCSTGSGPPPPAPPPPVLPSATQRLIYSPFASDGRVKSGLNVVLRAGECSTGSYKAAGAYRCITGDRLRDPCYLPGPSDGESVVCVGTPWDRTVVRVALMDSLPEPSTSGDVPRAWALELVSGERRCAWLSGSTTVARGYRLNYACGRTRFLFGSPRTTGQVWKIRYSRTPTGKRLKLVNIRRAWL